MAAIEQILKLLKEQCQQLVEPIILGLRAVVESQKVCDEKVAQSRAIPEQIEALRKAQNVEPGLLLSLEREAIKEAQEAQAEAFHENAKKRAAVHQLLDKYVALSGGKSEVINTIEVPPELVQMFQWILKDHGRQKPASNFNARHPGLNTAASSGPASQPAAAPRPAKNHVAYSTGSKGPAPLADAYAKAQEELNGLVAASTNGNHAAPAVSVGA